MICRPLREDPCHAAAAVVGMRNGYRSFQAEVVGQNTLKLGLRDGVVMRWWGYGEKIVLARPVQQQSEHQSLQVLGSFLLAL